MQSDPNNLRYRLGTASHCESFHSCGHMYDGKQLTSWAGAFERVQCGT